MTLKLVKMVRNRSERLRFDLQLGHIVHNVVQVKARLELETAAMSLRSDVGQAPSRGEVPALVTLRRNTASKMKI